jgi:putative ABC transport system permease protein
MTLWLIILRSLRQHALSTIITALSIALAGGLLMSVWIVKVQSQATFTGVNGGFDAILGARGSKLQLVLNSIFHLENSPGNVSAADYLDIKKNPSVALAIPIAVGDNYHGYRLVGTVPEMFEKVEYAPGKHYELEAGGHFFGDATNHEAVVGSFVAQKMGLKMGDTFHPYHGLIFNEKEQHADTYVVSGVMKPSNTPSDRVIWIPLEGIQKMSGHDPKMATDVSAVLVKLKGGGMTGIRMDMMYNRQGDRLTFAWPIGATMADLFSKISWFDKVLALVSYLVALVATGSILASIYNSMNERRREIAILRALGARRRIIFGAIILEAAAISALGMVVAFVFYWAIMTGAAAVIRAQTGIVLEPFKFNMVMLWAPAALITLGALAGVVPAVKAYRTDVAGNLVPAS